MFRAWPRGPFRGRSSKGVAGALSCLALTAACAAGGAAKPAATAQHGLRDTRMVHEECDIGSAGAERLDANGDGRPEVTIVRRDGREVCRAVDLNFDGVIDVWVYRDGQGSVRRRETDYDRDGRIDEIIIFNAGVPSEIWRSTNIAERADTWHIYEAGRLVRTERDSDADGRVDQWWEYASAGCPLIHTDTDGDGRPDPGTTVDYCKETGYAPPERFAPPSATGPTFKRQDELPTELDAADEGEGEPGASGAGEPSASKPKKDEK